MKIIIGAVLVINCFYFEGMAQYSNKRTPRKEFLINSIDQHSEDLKKISDKIWEHAELALVENNSSQLLSDYAESQGFKVEKGVAEMPTAFIASYGSGSPIIGILGEFDALPDLSQKAIPKKTPLKAGNPGHGCGHNLFGVGSLGAAIAIKDLLQQNKIKGTLRFYGTPAEEAIGGKVYMARAGLFNDLDICLDWHPNAEIEASNQSSQAIIEVIVEFTGQAAHAAYDPWNGKSALDGLESFIHGINLYREHMKPSARIHYIIEKGGSAPNVVPDYARLNMYIRDATREGVFSIYERIQQMAEGAGKIADVTAKLSITSGYHEQLTNRTGAEVLQNQLALLGNMSYTLEEISFAKSIQKSLQMPELGIDGTIKPIRETLPFPEGGSSDVADISWITPEISLTVTTAPIGTPWHSWAVVACGGMSIGHKGMLYAAKALALTMGELFENQTLIKNIRTEFTKKRGNYVYKSIIPDGPPPLPQK